MLAAKGLLQAALLFLYSGIGAVAAKEDTEKGGVKACQDTPGWSNGWSGCAWLPGGKDPALCRPTINASWPSTAGWTCEYYRQQGLCGQKDGTVKEIRQSARGSLHMWPEKNCCGCEAQDDTTCNRQTGKVCALTCGYSNGPAYCHNFSRCLCLPGHCASSDGICSLETKQDVGSKSSVPICRDTPDWTNGWSACAYEEGGRNPAWCRSTPGASWPSTLGWTCEYYRANGLCKEGKVNSWASGELHNYPEYNCCGCHKPSNTTCNRNTGGICFMGVCDKSRGPTVCVDGKCLCQEGHCGTTTGTCSLTVDSYNEPLTPEGVKEATGEATHAGISAAEAAESAGKNAAQDVQAAAKAAGQAALRSGLSAENAAEVRNGYTQDPVCVKRNCVNPLVPGLEEFGHNVLEEYQGKPWRCLEHVKEEGFVSSRGNLSLQAGFCQRVVSSYPFAIPDLQGRDRDSIIKDQTQRAVTSYVAHLRGLGRDFWDYEKPWEADTCTQLVWKMVCYTHFPRCNQESQESYLRPCANACQGYLDACEVNC
ncbi:unnamed protein product [Durusdinium trenchii]|uniref:Uncharacterized protein n=1 Tax=Durusdinium trenchii TaxID=1381693 RepID=A0ABP0SK62_9DINO